MTTRRSVSKLLRSAYQDYLGDAETALYEPCLRYVWARDGYGEGVLAEAYVALENSSRDIAGTKRMSLQLLEDRHPELLMAVVNRAIDLCESVKQ